MAEQSSGSAAHNAGLAAVSQHAVRCSHIAPEQRAGIVRALRVEQGRKSPAWRQHDGNMEHMEQAGVKSQCVCVCEKERERAGESKASSFEEDARDKDNP